MTNSNGPQPGDAAPDFTLPDVEGRMMTRYVDERLLTVNPFESIDELGVGVFGANPE